MNPDKTMISSYLRAWGGGGPGTITKKDKKTWGMDGLIT